MTKHEILIGNSNDISGIADKSVNLIITSPPYPMIKMWDAMFSQQDPQIAEDLEKGQGLQAFYKMHDLLNAVWKECNRVLADNGFMCINVGDATRTINGDFKLYSNHTQIINHFLSMEYSVLPDIHWRKQSNAPNKFMGSGMYCKRQYKRYQKRAYQGYHFQANLNGYRVLFSGFRCASSVLPM
ncbi:MAG: DNA methyltransferase, partial [Eubacteriales bacterium]|nr:DNA methyltransferase [Eubacteriales bacterium]MDD3199217.1 DNA methyltransferase [Eubacteriales bacterium]MDD4629128.1 DNA methyltransferase [Eubacteriales bacterium]